MESLTKNSGVIFLFGKRIVALRKENNLSQRALADKLELTRSALSLYELEKREPNIDILIRMAQFFNVSSDYIIGLSDEHE